jgi:TonB family protein
MPARDESQLEPSRFRRNKMTTAIPVRMNLNFEWMNYRSGIGVNVMSFILALAIHAPLFFMRLDMSKPHVMDTKSEILLDGIEIIQEIPKPKVAPPPPPPKAPGWKDKLAHLVKKDPPPPPPPAKGKMDAPEKLATAPNQIALAPKMELPKMAPKMDSKANFQTSQPKMLDEKKIDLKPMTPSISAPLTQNKVGFQDKGPSKTSRDSFQLAKNTSISSIGGKGPSVTNPNAPTIAIPTGKAGRQEGFSAAPPSSLSDKGKAGFSGTSLTGASKNMTLREQALAQSAASSQIDVGNSRFSGAGGVAGGVEGGSGTKQDAGRYQGGGSFGGVPGGVAGGVPGGTGSAGGVGSKGVAGGVAAPSKVREKKSQFQITGLKDRNIEHRQMPEYPAWAREQGIEAAVILKFVVTAQGHVKDSIITIRSSGHPRLDESAMKALRNWKFSALPAGSNEEQVGQITFNYQIF